MVESMNSLSINNALASTRFAAPIPWRWIVAGLFLAAVILRSGLLGNPLVGDDEQFYLLVADRMWHGDVPYIDIFDRKPYGLFLLFAGMRALGGEGLIASQTIALLFAAVTAFAVTAAAATRVAYRSAVMAGLFYLVILEPMAGGTTQAPIFFNFLTATAGWLVLGTRPDLSVPGDLRRACWAMLLCGLAIQIKTNVAFESVAIGGWLVWRLSRSRPLFDAATLATLFVAIGVAPTFITACGFAMTGHFDAWWFANVQSQFAKTGGFDSESMGRLAGMLVQGGPVLIAGIAGVLLTPSGERRVLLGGWLLMSLIEAFSIGNFWIQYLLPTAVVTSISAAEVFARPKWGRNAFLLLVIPPALITVGFSWMHTQRGERTLNAALAALPADVSTTCMLTYDAPVSLLQFSHACLVTPYIFVDEFRSQAEAHALPVDATTGLRAALAHRPGVIVAVEHSQWRNRNRVNDALLRTALTRNYRKIAIVPRELYTNDPESLVIWRRRDLP